MKKKFSFVLAIIASFALSFSTFAQDKKAAWPEMKAYHAIMSATFHPAEDGNLKPVRERSSELVKAAEAWQKSTPPAELNKPGLKEKLELLTKESAGLDKLVQSKGNDAEVKARITKLHDVFHDVVGLCMDEKHEKGKEAPGHEGHGHEGHKH